MFCHAITALQWCDLKGSLPGIRPKRAKPRAAWCAASCRRCAHRKRLKACWPSCVTAQRSAWTNPVCKFFGKYKTQKSRGFNPGFLYGLCQPESVQPGHADNVVAAVHISDFTGYPGGQVRAQKSRSIAHVLNSDVAANGRGFLHVFQHAAQL